MAQYPCLVFLMSPLPGAGYYPIKHLVAGHAASLSSTRRAVASLVAQKPVDAGERSI